MCMNDCMNGKDIVKLYACCSIRINMFKPNVKQKRYTIIIYFMNTDTT